MMAGIIELINRVVIVIFLTDTFGFLAICLADSVNWVITAVFLLTVYFIATRSHKNKNKEFYIEPICKRSDLIKSSHFFYFINIIFFLNISSCCALNYICEILLYHETK